MKNTLSLFASFLFCFITITSHAMAPTKPPIESINLQRANFEDGIATVRGMVTSSQSEILEVSVNGNKAHLVGNQFEAVLPADSSNISISAINKAGSEKTIDEQLGTPITVHLSRAIKDNNIIKLVGEIKSPFDPITAFSINDSLIALDDSQAFNIEVPVTDTVSISAENSSGGRDFLIVDFTDRAPTNGIALKLTKSGLEEISSLASNILNDSKETIAGLINGVSSGINVDTNFLKLSLADLTTQIGDGNHIQLSPNENNETLDLALKAAIPNIEITTQINAQICIIWCTATFAVPLEMQLSDVELLGNIYVTAGLQGPQEEQTLARLATDIRTSIGNNDVFFNGGDTPTPLIGSLISLVIQGEVNNVVTNLVNNEVGNLLTTLPTKIPALLVDNDNGVSEIIDGIGILPIYKMLVRGIGATIGVSESFSTEQDINAAIDANFITSTADDNVKFGYISRNLPHNQDSLSNIETNTNYDGLLVLDSDVLNKTFSVLNQASLMDITFPLLDVENISPLLEDKDISLRIYSRNGMPYFSTPKKPEELIALELNDYVLELSIDNSPLLEINTNLFISAALGFENNQFSFSALNTSYEVISTKLNGTQFDDIAIQHFIELLSNIAAANVLNVVSTIAIPTLPGNKTISIDTLRLTPYSSDIAIALSIQDASALVDNNSASKSKTSPSDIEVTVSSLSDAPNNLLAEGEPMEGGSGSPVDIALPQFLLDIVNGIGGIFTVIGNDPLDKPAPTSGIDTIDPNLNQPHIPAINRQTVAIKDGKFTRPRMSDVRLTRDGRLGVSAFGLTLTLQKPEMIHEPFVAASEPLLITDQEFSLSAIYNESEFLEGQNIFGGSSAICDPDPQYVSGGKKENPYSCGTNGEDDCYDVHIVSTDNLEEDTTFGDLLPVLDRAQIKVSKSQMHSVPVTVRIENPKTTSARIADVEVLGPAKVSKPFSALLFEMTVPVDGRLFITRISGRALTWYNENTDQYVNGAYDAVYAVIPESADACDISQFTEFKPMSHAPYDEAMSRYKFAAYPFRDPMGKPIPDGAEMKGTYPWVSMDGSMMTLTTIGDSRLFPRHHVDGNPMTRYPSRCLPDESDCSIETRADVQFRSLDSGFVFFGLWTQGKMVLVDNLINESDFKLGNKGGDKEHSLVSLYAPGTGVFGNEDGEIEVGETREATIYDRYGVRQSYGTALGNGTIFDSVTNRLNFWPTAKPLTPRDVVWTVSSGRQTDELAFDDYLNPDALIVSHMVGAQDSESGNDIAMTYYDGWNQANLDFTNPVRVQNSATALPYKWTIPQYGEVHFGRLEPTATGGVQGKGLWLDGQKTYLSYDIKPQPQNVKNKPWFTNLFIDPRFEDDTTERALIYFPDGSAITLVGLNTIQYRNKQFEIVHQITLPEALNNIAWTQVALQASNKNRHFDLYLNGFLLDRWNTEEAIFEYQAGRLTIGGNGNNAVQPFKGWIDDLKVIAQGTNPEVVCNHAKGTLVGIGKDSESELAYQANLYPGFSHQRLSQILQGYGQETYPQYACYFDNTNDYAAHLQNIPTDVVPLRDAFIFPEGPLYSELPRPDSLNNNFCLSCHHAAGKGGLDLAALSRDLQIAAKYDHRRQPMQAPPRVGGNLPENWLPGTSSYASVTPEEGLPFDELLMESGLAVMPEAIGFTLVNADNGFDIQPIADGVHLDRSSLPENLAIRVAANGATQMVAVSINDDSQVLESPYSIFGTQTLEGGKRIFLPGELNAGTYQLSAIALNSDQAPVAIEFSIYGEKVSSEAAEPDPEIEAPEDDGIPLFEAVFEFFEYLYDSFSNALA